MFNKRAFLYPFVVFMAATTGCSDSVENGTSDGTGTGGEQSASGQSGSSGQPDTAGGPAPVKTDGGVYADAFVECTAYAETAQNTRGPADVVIAIDNTPSMYNEIEEVRANMNRLSEMVGEEGLDLHIVLVSCFSEGCLKQSNWHTICIDPPVGTDGACSSQGNGDDSNLPGFLHVDENVESRKALENIIDAHSEWSSALRDQAAKHIVVVSDDGDDWTAEQFTTALSDADDRFAEYQFHGIFSFLGKEDACGISNQEPCCTYAAPGGEGTVYKELVQQTQGVQGDLCLQDFDPVFDALAGAVIDSARLNCEWAIPDPPDGMNLEPALVNVEYTDGSGQAFIIGRIDGPRRCDQVEHAWYYNDEAAPTHVLICPQTCDWIQGQQDAQIRVQFGCDSFWEDIE